MLRSTKEELFLKYTYNPNGPIRREIAVGSAHIVVGYLQRRLKYLRRVDQQVKISGHRIELGEIKGSPVGRSDWVERLWFSREDVAADKRLVA